MKLCFGSTVGCDYSGPHPSNTSELLFFKFLFFTYTAPNIWDPFRDFADAIGRSTDWPTDRLTDRPTDRPTERRTERRTERPNDVPNDLPTDRPTYRSDPTHVS